jgi:hypothetical protein
MPPLIPQKDGASVRIDVARIFSVSSETTVHAVDDDRPRQAAPSRKRVLVSGLRATVFAAWVKIKAPGRSLKPKHKDTVMVIFFLPLVGTLFGLALAFRPS